MYGHFQTGGTRSTNICGAVGSYCGSVVHPKLDGRTAAPGVFYLLPIALVATLYGSLLATLYGIAATFCAAFFLYDPLYSFYVASPLDVGELVCFVGLALIGAKCAADLLQPLVALRQQNSAAEE